MQTRCSGIELASLRESLWRRPGEAIDVPSGYGHVPDNARDITRIDEGTMAVDLMSKQVESDKLSDVVTSRARSAMRPIGSIAKNKSNHLA